MSEEKILAVERYADVVQAEFALSVLHGSGIEAYLDVPHTGGMFPHLVLAQSWVSLMVREEDLERARDVLAAGAGES